MAFDLSRGNSSALEKLRLINEESSSNVIYEPKKYNFQKYYNFKEETLIEIKKNDGMRIYDPTSILNNSHWGQLKLFLSEFYTLTHELKDDVTDIVYVGAAPGNHIYVLAQLFEDYNYHLYDSMNFDKRLNSLENVRVYKKYFDDNEMKKWKRSGRKIFLISDIRTLSYSANSYTEESQKLNEKAVWADMKLQEKWITFLEPELSLIKFRLPFGYDFILEEGKMREYLDGKILRQVYNKPTSSETRLLVKNISYKNYDIIEYERKLAYHNNEIRNKLKFQNLIDGSNKPNYEKKGLLNNFDDTYFLYVVTLYIEKIDEEPNEKNIKTMVDYILDNLCREKINLLSKKAKIY